MKKIPNVFERDWNGDRSRVLPELHKGADVAWVLAGEGVPTVKWDGSACMFRNGLLYARLDVKRKEPPPGWIAADEPDEVTGHRPGWIWISNLNAYQWHAEALLETVRRRAARHGAPPPPAPGTIRFVLPEGTYEAIGPNFQTNPYRLERDVLVRHGNDPLEYGFAAGGLPLHTRVTAGQLYDFLCILLRTTTYLPPELEDIMPAPMPLEGVVWHHPDGRMAKALASDLGLRWKAKTR